MVKISVIGAGRVGSITAFAILEEKLADELIVIDIIENLAKGEAIDLAHCCKAGVIGGSDYSLIKDSDIVIVPAGVARKPGMDRSDLAKINTKIIISIAEKIKQYAPNSIVIVTTNPLDIMTRIMLKYTGFKPEKVIGLSGALDSLRFRHAIAEHHGISPASIEAYVIGEHGNLMVPLLSSVRVSGKQFRPDRSILDKVIFASQKPIELKGATYFAPAVAVAHMVRAIVNDEKKMFACSVYYKPEDICIGLPCKLGKNGVEEIIMPKMDDEETKLFDKSVEKVKADTLESEKMA